MAGFAYQGLVTLPLPPHQLLRLYPDDLGDTFQALEGEVAFSSLNTAHVGAVYTQDFGEGFLAETVRLTVGAQVRAYRPLQISHRHKAIASPGAT